MNIGFPVNTDLKNFLYHYKALFDAHGIQNCLPTYDAPTEKLGNVIEASNRTLLHDFKTVNAKMYEYKNLYGDVKIIDMKIVREQATITVELG